MSEIGLNKWEKEKRVIELHLEGKTIRNIAPIVHMSFRDISKIIKAYDKKIRLQQSREENNQQKTKTTKSLSTRAFILYKKNRDPSEVKVLLDIPFQKARLFWRQYLKSIRMFESFEFYQDHSYDIPTFLSIDVFMKRNNIYGKNVVNVLRTASDIFHLNQTYSKLKEEIKNLELKRMSLFYYPNSSYSLQPLLPLNKPNYNHYHY
jgi:hypothetical protein